MLGPVRPHQHLPAKAAFRNPMWVLLVRGIRTHHDLSSLHRGVVEQDWARRAARALGYSPVWLALGDVTITKST